MRQVAKVEDANPISARELGQDPRSRDREEVDYRKSPNLVVKKI
jgi:hypothetical protein